MDLLKIQNAGYTKEDVKILAGLFSANLNEFSDALEHSDHEQLSGLLHKLKGGLNLMMDDELVRRVEELESINNHNTSQLPINDINQLLTLAHIHLKELLEQL